MGFQIIMPEAPKPMPKFALLEGHIQLLDKMLDQLQIRLIHATRVENLSSIVEHGLVPVSHSKFSSLDRPRTNDDFRSNHGGNCLSVGWPNTRTLATWGPIGAFALIEIDSSVLLNKTWYCFPTNSSSRECLDAYEKNPLVFSGADSLAHLFLESTTTNKGRLIQRNKLGTPLGLPNDPQAEIVIDEVIEPWWFKEVIFPTAAALEKFQKLDVAEKVESVVCDPRAFAPRFDAGTWSRGERISLADWQRGAP